MSSLRSQNKNLVQAMIMEGRFLGHAPQKVTKMYLHDLKILYSLKKRGME